MNSPQTTDPNIQRFLTAIGPALRAYRCLALSFVAIVHEGEEVVLGMTLRLSVDPPPISMPEIWTQSLRAAQILLPNAAETLPDIIELLLSGHGLLAGDHLLKLLPSSQDKYSSYHEASALSIRKPVRFLERLFVRGESKWTLINSTQHDHNRELQSKGFEALYDLLQEYGLDDSQDTYVEVLASPLPVFVSGSKIEGPSMRIVARLPKELSHENFQVAIRSANRAERGTRRSIDSTEFEWATVSEYHTATFCGQVTPGSVLECSALYAGTNFDLIQLYDPATFSNARRMVVELNDPGLKHLSNVLTKIRERDYKLRNDFEAAVAVLFHMLGFDTIRIGGSKKLTDGPDIYATTPNGDLLVVECTSGSFNSDKLGKLITRTNQAQAHFSETLVGPECVSALIVSPRTLAELESGVAMADRAGVILLCGSHIEEAIERTRFAPDADAVLTGWKRLATLRYLSAPNLD